MKKWKTKDSLSDTFNTALTEWLDNNEVDYSKYPIAHQNALYHQYKIGWRHVFTGHISQEWEKLQGDTVEGTKTIKSSDWASAMVTCILEHVIILWETRNEELHGKTKSEQNHKLLQRQKQTISKLISMKDKCLARDHFLFPLNPSSLLEETSTTKFANWIATRTQLIKMSIQQALKIDTQNTNPLTKWFTPRDAPTKPQRMQWHRNRLLHDPFNKKKRNKDDRTSTSHSRKSTYQTKLTDHLI